MNRAEWKIYFSHYVGQSIIGQRVWKWQMTRLRRLPFLVGIGQTVVMLTISPPPELEEQLHIEAQKRGIAAEELTVEALRVFLKSNGVPDEAEAKRLAAIDELMGMGAHINFSTENLHRDRREDAARDEAQYQRQFGKDAD